MMAAVAGASGAAKDLVGTFRARATSTANGTSITFTNQSIGPAPTGSDRRFVFVWAGMAVSGGNPTVTSITVGGNACTLLTTRDAGTSFTCRVGYVEIASGTTANVTVGYDTTSDLEGIMVWSVVSGSAGISILDDVGGTSDDVSANVVDGGFVLAGAWSYGDSTATYTGLTQVSSGSSIGSIASTSNYMFGADHTPTTDQTPRTMDFTLGGLSSTRSLISIQPA